MSSATWTDHATPVGSRRCDWIDAAKGVAILLVVFGHCWRGLERAGVATGPRLFSSVDGAIYAVHMPTFFLVSGLFFAASARSTAPTAFVTGRIVRIVWPMTLWTWVFVLAKIAAGDMQNATEPFSWSQLLPLPPYLHMWFLWALLLLQLACYPLARLEAAWGGARFWWIVLVGSVPLALALSGRGGALLGPAALHAPYFVLGLALARPLTAPPAGRREAAATRWTGGAALGVAMLVGATTGAQGAAPTLALGALGAAGLVVFLRGATPNASGTPIWTALRLIGRASLTIFLAHTIFSAGLREAMFAVGIDGLAVHLVLGTAIGIAVPMAMRAAARRSRLDRVFALT